MSERSEPEAQPTSSESVRERLDAIRGQAAYLQWGGRRVLANVAFLLSLVDEQQEEIARMKASALTGIGEPEASVSDVRSTAGRKEHEDDYALQACRCGHDYDEHDHVQYEDAEPCEVADCDCAEYRETKDATT